MRCKLNRGVNGWHPAINSDPRPDIHVQPPPAAGIIAVLDILRPLQRIAQVYAESFCLRGALYIVPQFVHLEQSCWMVNSSAVALHGYMGFGTTAVAYNCADGVSLVIESSNASVTQQTTLQLQGRCSPRPRMLTPGGGKGGVLKVCPRCAQFTHRYRCRLFWRARARVSPGMLRVRSRSRPARRHRFDALVGHDAVAVLFQDARPPHFGRGDCRGHR